MALVFLSSWIRRSWIRWLVTGPAVLPSSLAHGSGIRPDRAIVSPVRLDDSLAIAAPIVSGQLRELVDDPERAEVLFRIGFAQQRLGLQQRLRVLDLDRTIRCRQPNVDEERTEPAVRLEDAFVTLEGLASRQIDRRSYQQAPPRRRLYEQPGPDLHDTGKEASRQERRRKSFDVVRRQAVEVLRESSESAPRSAETTCPSRRGVQMTSVPSHCR